MDLITCLCFNGNAREAATFYTSIFPDNELADNWLAPTETPGNRQGEEVVVNFRIFGKPFSVVVPALASRLTYQETGVGH